MKYFIFPFFNLAGHHFSIYSTNVDASVDTCFVVSINNVPSKGFVRANTTVVRSLISIGLVTKDRLNQMFLNAEPEIIYFKENNIRKHLSSLIAIELYTVQNRMANKEKYIILDFFGTRKLITKQNSM